MTLVEIMICIGIMAIAMAGMATLQANQNKETRALGEVLASQDLQRTLTQVLATGSVCGFLFTNPDVSGLSPATAQFSTASFPIGSAFTLNKIPGTALATAPAAAATGTMASNYSSSLQIQSMQIDVTSAGSSNQFFANLVVNFNLPSLLPGSPVRQVRPLSLPVVLQTNVVGTTATVVGCTLSGQMTSDICTALGGNFDPATLQCSGVGPSPATICGELGGAWNPGGAPQCAFPYSSQAQLIQSCASVGGTWVSGANPPCRSVGHDCEIVTGVVGNPASHTMGWRPSCPWDYPHDKGGTDPFQGAGSPETSHWRVSWTLCCN
jgi:type II secretory pathway pseudopilin PulG